MTKLVEKWEHRRKTDEEWGIEPEKDLINYATMIDYFRNYKKILKALYWQSTGTQRRRNKT